MSTIQFSAADAESPATATPSYQPVEQILHDTTLDAHRLGTVGESYASAWLEHHGWRILDRNWRTRYGEIDIVAMTPERDLVFVEVKTRRTTTHGLPQEAVDQRKQANVRRASMQWLVDDRHRVTHRSVRFDVIAIIVQNGKALLEHIPEAF